LIREGFWLIVTTKEWTMRTTSKSPGEKIVKDIASHAEAIFLRREDPDRKAVSREVV
jgi:hypothetical protein